MTSYTDYDLTVYSAPATEPVSALDAKLWCRIDTSAEDTVIESLITLARIEAETLSERAFITRTYNLTLDQWQLGSEANVIRLPYPPALTISQITYYTAAGVLTTLASTEYTLVTGTIPGYVHPAIGKSWPTDLREFSPITIRYTAGYGTARSAVPASYRQLIAGLVGLDWEARDQVTPDNRRARDLLTARLRMDRGYA